MKLKYAYAIITGLLVCLIVTASDAAIYSYRDEHGRLFLTDSPPNSKYKIVVTTKKECEAPDSPDSVHFSKKQTFLLPNDDSFSNHINEASPVFPVISTKSSSRMVLKTARELFLWPNSSDILGTFWFIIALQKSRLK